MLYINLTKIVCYKTNDTKNCVIKFSVYIYRNHIDYFNWVRVLQYMCHVYVYDQFDKQFDQLGLIWKELK